MNHMMVVCAWNVVVRLDSQVHCVDPRISEGNGTEPPLDMQNLRICKNMNIIKTE